MMKIGSVNTKSLQGAGSMKAGKSNMQMQSDSVSKNIQNQIANAQKQLQEISTNEKMTLEQKMKKKQEIQQEIANLNQQLRQHQIEQRTKQQSKSISGDNRTGGKQGAGKAKSDSKGNGLSQSGMEALMAADASMKQAQVQRKAAANIERKADILKSEIKQGGGNTEVKEAELAKTEAKAQNAAAFQMNTLASINQEANEASKEASKENQDKASDKKAKSGSDKRDIDSGATMQPRGMEIEEDASAKAMPVTPVQTNVHVDVRL